MSESRVSRMGLPLSRDSRVARRRECFCKFLATAYKCLAWVVQPASLHFLEAALAAATASSTSAVEACMV